MAKKTRKYKRKKPVTKDQIQRLLVDNIETQFPLYNQISRKWGKEELINVALQILKYVKENNNCLHVDEAILHIGIPKGTFEYNCRIYEELKLIREDIRSVILVRVNKGALKGEMPAAPAIFRMKQLGEHEIKIIKDKENDEDRPLNPSDIEKARTKHKELLDEY